MPDRGAVTQKQMLTVYCYDGSFEGLLSCVFESYENNEIPSDVLPEGAELPLLLPVKAIATDSGKAKRVLKSIPQKMGYTALNFVRRAFLTCHPKKELLVLQFLRLGYRYGASVQNRLTDETVHTLTKAVRHLDHEVHQFKGFIRFSEVNGALVAQIEPKNIVLPLIAQHFCERYPGETFLIYDRTHGMALIYQNNEAAICDADAFEQPEYGEDERQFRALWQLFYNTIEIKERRNPRCRMSHMPKRYWNCMTEFAAQLQIGPAKQPEASARRVLTNGAHDVLTKQD